MAAHFDLGGLSIERYYHFVCKADRPTFELMAELGIGDKMRWVPTIDGLLRRRQALSLRRSGFVADVSQALADREAALRRDDVLLDQAQRRATAWRPSRPRTGSRAGAEAAVYERLWAPLFRLKFFEYADNISAAWIWTRIKRVGTSRSSLLQEELGYIEGGSETLVHALTARDRGAGRHLAAQRAGDARRDRGRPRDRRHGGRANSSQPMPSSAPCRRRM